MNNQYLINGTYYYFAWGNQTKEDFYYAINNFDIKKIIFFGPEEHEIGNLFSSYSVFTDVKKILKNKNIKHQTVISANNDPKLNYLWPFINEKNFLSWDDFFAYLVVQYASHQNLKPYEHNTHITKHFVSLNARAHPWRCMFIDNLFNEGLFNYGYVSWHNAENWEYPYRFKYWQPEIINFDELWLADTTGILDIMKPPERQFKDSLFSVISESHDQVLKITEKTYLPIYHKRPFIVHGPQHFHLLLKKQGFKLFDEIFDYSFDAIPNDKDGSSVSRCKAMLKETKKIIDYDPNDLYKILKTKVEYNYQNLINIVIKRNVNKEIKKIINEMKLNFGDNYNNVLNIADTKNFIKLTRNSK
jgi:hypothetical protein